MDALNNPMYLFWMADATLLTAGLHYMLTGKMQRRGALTWLTWALGIVLGVVCAKAVYAVIECLQFAMATGLKNFRLMDALLSTDLSRISYFGGVLGVCLGAALAGKITGNRPMAALNAYAPAGMLMAALARFGEGFLGTLCAGRMIENERLWFFPVAVQNSWGEGYLAVFLLAGLCCQAVCALSLWGFREDRFLRTLFYLCLPQILLESLRGQSLVVHEFVRIEQLICMVVIEVILILYGVWGKGHKARFVPAAVGLACAGLFVAVEFTLGGKLFNSVGEDYGLVRRVIAEEEDWIGEAGGKTNWTPFLAYCAMALGLAVLAWMEMLGYKNARERLRKA